MHAATTLRSTALRVIGVLAVFLLTGCAKKQMLVVTVGGLGFSQMGDLRRAIMETRLRDEVSAVQASSAA